MINTIVAEAQLLIDRQKDMLVKQRLHIGDLYIQITELKGEIAALRCDVEMLEQQLEDNGLTPCR